MYQLTSRQQQTQRTLLDWLRVEYEIEKPSTKLLSVTDLDSDTWVGEVKRLRGKKRPLTAAGLQALRDEYTRTIRGEGRRQNVECRNPRRGRPDVGNRPAPDARSAVMIARVGEPRG